MSIENCEYFNKKKIKFEEINNAKALLLFYEENCFVFVTKY